MKTIYIATGTIPDGYFGERVKAYFVYDPETLVTFAVTHCGYFRASCPPAVDPKEALWLLHNHPACDNIRL